MRRMLQTDDALLKSRSRLERARYYFSAEYQFKLQRFRAVEWYRHAALRYFATDRSTVRSIAWQ
jgi:hypothetical protein